YLHQLLVVRAGSGVPDRLRAPAHPGALVTVSSLSAGGAEIGAAGRHHLVDRLRYYVLLVGKLPEILDIVDDDLGAGVLERDDVACEAGETVERAGKCN